VAFCIDPRGYSKSGKSSHTTIMSILVIQRCSVLLPAHEASMTSGNITGLTCLQSREPHAETPAGSGPESAARLNLCPVTWLSQTKTMAQVIQQYCLTGQRVPLLRNIPGMALPISLDVINDYSRHKKSCCHSCSPRMILSHGLMHLVPLCKWCLRSDQGVSATCVH